MAEHVSPGSSLCKVADAFTTSDGSVLEDVQMAYEAFGRLADDRGNVVLVLTGLSPSAHIAAHPGDTSPGWWEPMVGAGRPFDTDHWHVLCVNTLGSCKGSTGPASLNPATGRPYRLSFPPITVDDMAEAVIALLQTLGIDRVACVVGVSMGAMTALALLARRPGIASAHISISGAVHSLPFAIALRSLQREVVTSDPAWRGGEYDDQTYPTQGMQTARKLGLLSYRSAAEWDRRFHRGVTRGAAEQPGLAHSAHFEVEAYLDAHGRRFARTFDPNSFLYLSRAIDLFDLGTLTGGAARSALAELGLDRALVLGVATDILFPPEQQREIADGLQAGGTETSCSILGSVQGHDSFLVDIERFGPPVAAFLQELSPTAPSRRVPRTASGRAEERPHV